MKLTSSDIQKKKARIEEYKRQLKELQKDGYDTGDKEHIGYFYNSGQVIFSEQQQILLSFINREQAEIDAAEIVDELEIPDNIIGIGDYVTMLMAYDGEEPGEATMLLCDERRDGELCISTSSPIGLAIYGKEVGSVVQCKTPKAMLTITILEKSRGRQR